MDAAEVLLRKFAETFSQAGWVIRESHLELKQQQQVVKASHMSTLHYVLVALYLSIKQPAHWRIAIGFLWNTLFGILLGLFKKSSSLRLRNNRVYFARDMLLTDKHIRLWNHIVDSGSEFGLIFSDDLLVHLKDSEQIDLFTRLHAILVKNEGNTYVDLSVPYSPYYMEQKLRIKLESISEDFMTGLFFSSTSACYMISRDLAQQFINMLAVSPWLKAGSIDWLLTYIGRKTQKESSTRYLRLSKNVIVNQSLSEGGTLTA